MESKRALAFAIAEFLQSSVKDNTVQGDDAESLNVATQCISEAFGIDLDDAAQQKALSIQPASLLSIFEVFQKTQKKRQEVGAIGSLRIYTYGASMLIFQSSSRT